MIVFRDTGGNPLPLDPDASIAGYLPMFFDEMDPRPAREQLAANYAHGGGWRPMQGFRYSPTALKYPGDPPMRILAIARLRDEQLRLYRHSWLAIVQPDGAVEIGRVD